MRRLIRGNDTLCVVVEVWSLKELSSLAGHCSSFTTNRYIFRQAQSEPKRAVSSDHVQVSQPVVTAHDPVSSQPPTVEAEAPVEPQPALPQSAAAAPPPTAMDVMLSLRQQALQQRQRAATEPEVGP